MSTVCIVWSTIYLTQNDSEKAELFPQIWSGYHKENCFSESYDTIPPLLYMTTLTLVPNESKVRSVQHSL